MTQSIAGRKKIYLPKWFRPRKLRFLLDYETNLYSNDRTKLVIAYYIHTLGRRKAHHLCINSNRPFDINLFLEDGNFILRHIVASIGFECEIGFSFSSFTDISKYTQQHRVKTVEAVWNMTTKATRKITWFQPWLRL